MFCAANSRRRIPGPRTQYHSHEKLADLYGADPADIEAVEDIASAGHLCVTTWTWRPGTLTLAGAFGDLASLFGADVELHRVGNRVYRSRRGHLYVPPELAGRVIAVVGFDSRPVVHSQRSAAANEATVTLTLRAKVAGLYNFPKPTRRAKSKL